MNPKTKMLVIASVFVILTSPVQGQQFQATEPPDDPLIDVQIQQPDFAEPSGALIADPTYLDIQGDRFESAIMFENFVEDGDVVQALEAAETSLALTEQEFPPTDPELVPALNRVGQALLLNRRADEALTHFQRSIAIAESNHGVFGAELFDPLLGAGKALRLVGRSDEALPVLQRAQHVSHRNNGVYSLEQIPAIEEMAGSLMDQQKWTESEEVQLSLFKIYRNRFGADSIESLPALYKLANWYQDITDYRASRLTYKRGIKLIEDEFGPNDPRLLVPLSGIARNYLEEHDGQTFHLGLEVQQRIVQIAESNPDLDPDIRILARLDLGDWYILLNKEQDAWREYRMAWELAQETAPTGIDWEERFRTPHLIHPGPSMSIDFMGYGRVGDEVYYDFKYDIQTDGRPEDIEVLGSNLHGMTRAAAIQGLRYARFRPRIENGVTVETDNQTMRRIYPTDPPPDYGVSVNRRGSAGGRGLRR